MAFSIVLFHSMNLPACGSLPGTKVPRFTDEVRLAEARMVEAEKLL